MTRNPTIGHIPEEWSCRLDLHPLTPSPPCSETHASQVRTRPIVPLPTHTFLQPYANQPLTCTTHMHARTPTLSTARTWSIEAVTAATLREARDFVNSARKELFPSLGHDALLDDPRVLDESCVLVARDGSRVVVAAIAYVPFDYRFPRLPWPLGGKGVHDCNGVCDGGWGMACSCFSSCSTASSATGNSSSSSLAPADNLYSNPRRDEPCLLPFKVVEVLRLFVLPQYRRLGLAASLFSCLRNRAIASGVHCMYLHTHPFLPGAIRFWEKQGFDIVHVDEDDEVWQTHHMQMMLGPEESVQETAG